MRNLRELNTDDYSFEAETVLIEAAGLDPESNDIDEIIDVISIDWLQNILNEIKSYDGSDALDKDIILGFWDAFNNNPIFDEFVSENAQTSFEEIWKASGLELPF